MSAVPTTFQSWSSDGVRVAGIEPMALILAIQALIQNQVDQVLKELHLRRWSEWQHEDLRGQPPSDRDRRKNMLLHNFPGLLSGPFAQALQHQDWSPCYILSASIPISRLCEKSHGTDLQVLNVLWQHKGTRALSMSLYNNHLDASANFDHFVSENLSTNRHSQWAVGKQGQGFLRACHYILGIHQKAGRNPFQIGLSLRVGHTTGLFVYNKSESGKEALVLRRQDLTPLSFKGVSGDRGFVYPFDHLPHPKGTPPLPHKIRIAAIYNTRFLENLSEWTMTTQEPMEPEHERSLVKVDEVVVTIHGLEGSLTPEYLFSGVYGIFPPPPSLTWTVPARGAHAADITFFHPPMNSTSPENSSTRRTPGLERRGRFYYRDYLVPAGPSSHRLCVNYGGDLILTAQGMRVDVKHPLYAAYRRTLSMAIDTAIRTMPELAVELAYEILTEPDDIPDTFGRVLSPTSGALDDDAKQAYRAAFSKAWCRLHPTFRVNARAIYLYPYVAGTESTAQDRNLMEQLGLHPIPVSAHVKALLERVGVCPPIRAFADQLLRSAPGVRNEPPSIDVLKRCLCALFPNLRGGPLSVRQYPYSSPRAVWDEEAQIFVVASAACQCELRHDAELPPGHSSDLPCRCWLVPVLQEAVISWQTQNGQRGSQGDQTGSTGGSQTLASAALLEKRMFHVLYQNCKFPLLFEVPQEVSRPKDDHGSSSELEYVNLPAVPQAESAQQATSIANSTATVAHSPELTVSQPRAQISSIPRRLARLVLSATSSQAAHTSRVRTSEETLVETPSSTTCLWPEGLSDLQRILTAMGCSAEGSVVEIEQHHERQVSSLREELAQARQELQTVKQESATYFQQTSDALLESSVALKKKEDIINTMEGNLRDREAVLEEQKQEMAQKDERVRVLERQVRDMEGEMRQMQRVSERKFAQLTRVVQTWNREESVVPAAPPDLDDEDVDGPAHKRARVD